MILASDASTTIDQPKVNLLGMNRSQLASFVSDLGEKPFRATQLMKWIHQVGVTRFDEMTNISKVFRARLEELCEIRAPEITGEFVSTDGTRKWLVDVPGGSVVEAVFIPDGDRGTLCVSSQAGCSLDCSFCATGKQGGQRDVTAEEIIGQVRYAVKRLAQVEDANYKVTNVVMMGMGEPLLNFDNVMPATDLMMDDFAYGLSKRRVTLSTSGVVPAMRKMIGRTDLSLAVSLHAPNDELRNVLVPVNRKYPIATLLQTIAEYMDSVPDVRRVVTIEYTLIKGVNDSTAQAKELAQCLRNTPCKINLIPFNPFSLSDYEKPSKRQISRFQKTLHEAGYIVTVRTTRGDDIDAACGQLAGAINDRTRRSERHLSKRAEIQGVNQ